MPCSQSLVLVNPGHSTPPQRRRQMLGGGDTRRAHPKSLSGGAAFSSAPAVDILRSGPSPDARLPLATTAELLQVLMHLEQLDLVLGRPIRHQDNHDRKALLE